MMKCCIALLFVVVAYSQSAAITGSDALAAVAPTHGNSSINCTKKDCVDDLAVSS